MREPERPTLPAHEPVAADVTADILTRTVNASLDALLAEDRKAAALSHPWFDSEPDESALDHWPLEQPDVRPQLGAGVAAIMLIEIAGLLLLFG